MFTRFTNLLTLVGVVIGTVIFGYCLFLYSAAQEADAAQDRKTAELLRGEIKSHAQGILAGMSKFAVSQSVFSAVNTLQTAELEKRLCSDASGSASISTLGLMSLEGKAIFLCDGGKAKSAIEHGYIFEAPQAIVLHAFDQVILAQEQYQVVLPEFSYKQRYVQLADRPYFLVAALVAPDQSIPLWKTYQPIIIFGFSNLRNAFSDLESRLGIEDLHFAGNDTADKTSPVVQLQEGFNGQPAISIHWRRSNVFRSQLLKSLPVIFGCSILAFLFVVHLLKRIGRLQDALVTQESQSRYTAMHDSLTQLPNRAYFLDLAEKAVTACSIAAPVYVGIFDLDKFKSVNDTYGHDVGDKLIAETALRAVAALGSSNVVARLGGDEFAFVLTNARDDRQALEQLNALGQAIRQTIDCGVHRLRPTASIGAACAPNISMQLDKLLKAADVSLYAGKAEGGDRCRLFSEYDTKETLQVFVRP